MEKSKNEITQTTKDSNYLIIEKKETGVNHNNIFAVDVILISLALFFRSYVLENHEEYKYISTYALIFIGLIVGITIPSFRIIYGIKYKNNADTVGLIKYYKSFGLITLWKERISVSNAESLNLVRLNPLTAWNYKKNINRLLEIKSKYDIYLMYKDNSYSRLIGFNNYIEAKKILELLNANIGVISRDNSNEEYLDEDDYIRDYIRYRNLIKEIKEEKSV